MAAATIAPLCHYSCI